MTAAPDDDTLGLNLVYTDPSSLSSATNLLSGGGVVKKPKRKTKYDRRRERGKLAKLAKDDEKRKKRDGVGTSTATLQHQGEEKISNRDVGDISKVDVGGGSSSLAGIASLLGGSSVKEQKKRKTKPIDTATPTNVESESIEEEKKETAVDDDDAKPRAKVVANEEDTKSAANSAKEESKLEPASTSAQSTSLPLVENTKPTVSLAVEDTTSSSRRHRVSSKSCEHILCTFFYAHFLILSSFTPFTTNKYRHKQHCQMNNRQPIFLNFTPDHETWIGVNMPLKILKLVRLVHISLIPLRILRRRMMIEWMWIKKDKQRMTQTNHRQQQRHHVHLPS